MKTFELHMTCVDPTARVRGHLKMKHGADDATATYEPIDGIGVLELTHLVHQVLDLPKGAYEFEFSIQSMSPKVGLRLSEGATNKEVKAEDFTHVLGTDDHHQFRFEV